MLMTSFFAERKMFDSLNLIELVYDLLKFRKLKPHDFSISQSVKTDKNKNLLS